MTNVNIVRDEPEQVIMHDVIRAVSDLESVVFMFAWPVV